jgi:hypothetical protein
MRPRGDLFGRILGALILLGGLATICAVLWFAFQMFQDPNLGLGTSKNATAADVGMGFGKLILRIALLFVMSFCGSLIANKGISLYFASLPGAPAHDEAPLKKPRVTEEREQISISPSK